MSTHAAFGPEPDELYEVGGWQPPTHLPRIELASLRLHLVLAAAAVAALSAALIAKEVARPGAD